jgi:outer membrane protein OmpA-like peptidoglycan-associated protein
MKITRITMLRSLGLVLFATAACATTQPSPMLVEARESYDEAKNGPAGKFVPDLVYEAKTALDKAERAHARDPGSSEEEHLAYLAHRRTLLAKSAAESRMAHDDAMKADRAFETVLVSQRNEANEKVAKAGAQLDDERTKRQKAEEAARRAMASLAEIASVKAEEQRTVITLSGEVLFKTKEATLLPIAQTQLDKVAEALKSQGEDKQIVIEGHTDSQGKDAYNQALSQRRAEAVRSYLVSRGLPADMIKAVGKGEVEPIADNKTADGRANNRRVEIEIDNGGGSTPMSETSK